MKKTLLLACVSLFLWSSCTQELDDLGVDETPKNVDLKQAADGKYDLLGFGYDITGDYLDVTSSRSSVIDIEKFAQNHPGRINSPGTTKDDEEYFYGATSTDYIKEILNKSNFSASITGTELANKGLKAFSGTFSKNKEFNSKYEYSTKYSFASCDVLKRVKGFNINATVDTLSKYLTLHFKQDLNSLSADDLVLAYGTHVLTDIALGGRLTFTFRSTIVTEKNFEKKTDIVKAGLSVTIAKVAFGVNGDKETNVSTTLNTSNTNKRLQVNSNGGEKIDISYNLETGYPTINTGTWAGTVNTTNAGLTDVNWDKAYPIYDFISDPVKKAQVKTAVEKYIKSKQLEVLDIVPLHRYYSNSATDHFYTTKFETALGYDWKYEGVECYVFSKQVAGTIPLYRYYSAGATDHFYTIKFETALGSDWKYDNIEGYVYPNKVAGTIPLYRHYNNGNRTYDHFYTVEDVAYIGNNWKFEHIECYVFPAK